MGWSDIYQGGGLGEINDIRLIILDGLFEKIFEMRSEGGKETSNNWLICYGSKGKVDSISKGRVINSKKYTRENIRIF